MNSFALIRRLQEHRSWVNQTLLEAAESLADEQLQTGFPIGQGSVWRSLVHLYAAEYVWLEALEGDPLATLPGDLPGPPGNQKAQALIRTLPELRAHWRKLDVRWNEYLNALTEDALDETVYKQPSLSPDQAPLATTRGDVLLHLALHAQYTTAQIVNMLRQLSVAKLPDVMLISLARRQHPGNSPV